MALLQISAGTFCKANVGGSRSTAEITMDEGIKKILDDSAFFGNLCVLLETLLLSKLTYERENVHRIKRK